MGRRRKKPLKYIQKPGENGEEVRVLVPDETWQFAPPIVAVNVLTGEVRWYRPLFGKSRIEESKTQIKGKGGVLDGNSI